MRVSILASFASYCIKIHTDKYDAILPKMGSDLLRSPCKTECIEWYIRRDFNLVIDGVEDDKKIFLHDPDY